MFFLISISIAVGIIRHLRHAQVNYCNHFVEIAQLTKEQIADDKVCANYAGRNYLFYERTDMFIYFVKEFFQILPYLAFYLLAKPRDSFKELDKNPTRPYSIFQFTAIEHL